MKAGLYLALFHGRDDPDQDMDDWGYAGPVIGPLQFAQTTYASEIKLAPLDDDDTFFARYPFLNADFPRLDMHPIAGLVECQGKFYGDWSCYWERGDGQPG